MAPLRCCTFNCHGWNSGLLSLTVSIPISSASPSSNSHYITWSKISKRDLEIWYLSAFLHYHLNCSSTDCTHHMESLDNYVHQFITILIVVSVVFLATHVHLLIALLTGKVVLVNSRRRLILIRYG